MTTASDAVRESGLVESLMADYLAERVTRDEEVGDGRWIWDPDVDGVVGFKVRNGLGVEEVVLILWLEQEDFDCNTLYAHGEWTYADGKQHPLPKKAAPVRRRRSRNHNA